jgi:hypothetical protein
MRLVNGGWEVKATFIVNGKYPKCIRVEKGKWLGK